MKKQNRLVYLKHSMAFIGIALAVLFFIKAPAYAAKCKNTSVPQSKNPHNKKLVHGHCIKCIEQIALQYLFPPKKIGGAVSKDKDEKLVRVIANNVCKKIDSLKPIDFQKVKDIVYEETKIACQSHDIADKDDISVIRKRVDFTISESIYLNAKYNSPTAPFYATIFNKLTKVNKQNVSK